MARPSLAPPPIAPVADCELFSAILAQVLDLHRKLDALSNRLAVAPPDAAPAVLVRAIFDAVGARAFSAAELLAHAQLVPELRAAILGAIRVPNARKLGKLLSNLEGHNLDGMTVHRLGSESTGIIWSVQQWVVERR